MLRLRGVSRKFGDPPRWVLSNIDLLIEAGEFVCLVGSSGSGKTTLMRIIGGLDRPDLGACSLPTAHPPRIAMAFQEPRLVPWMSILDNLLLVSDHDASARAHDLLHLMELDGCAASYPGQISGGMQRRVALARALLIKPDLLLLDEPLTSLDAALEERMANILRSYWLEWQPAVIMVTHDPRQTARLASRAIGLTAGQPGLTLDEKLTGPAPGSRSERDEASIVRDLVNACPILPIAS
jgi:ABC-type nitrate/sulfonate/bicarbonate transport system ATPase subunit